MKNVSLLFCFLYLVVFCSASASKLEDEIHLLRRLVTMEVASRPKTVAEGRPKMSNFRGFSSAAAPGSYREYSEDKIQYFDKVAQLQQALRRSQIANSHIQRWDLEGSGNRGTSPVTTKPPTTTPTSTTPMSTTTTTTLATTVPVQRVQACTLFGRVVIVSVETCKLLKALLG